MAIDWNNVKDPIVQAEIERKAKAGIALDSGATADKQALYDKYIALQKSGVSTGFGGADYNTSDNATQKAIVDNISKLDSDPNFVKSEITRANDVIATKKAQGLDTTLQESYLANLLERNKKNSGGTTGGSTGGTTGGNTGGTTVYDATSAYGNAELDAKKAAEAKVNRAIAQSTDAINNLISRLASSRDKSVRSAETAAEQQRMALKDMQFQGFLANRQAMTNRGMTGSGIAQDADTRLGLAGQQQLSALYSDLANKRFSADEQYRLAEEEQLQALKTLEANKGNMTEEEVQNYLDRIYNRTSQRLNSLYQEAGVTGNFNGQRTLQGQQFDWGKIVDTSNLTGDYNGQRTLAGQTFDLNNKEVNSRLTGTYIDENGNVKQTSAEQQRQIENAWKVSQTLGKVTPELSKWTGIPAGTPTFEAAQATIRNNQAQQEIDNNKIASQQKASSVVKSASEGNLTSNQFLGSMQDIYLKKNIYDENSGEVIKVQNLSPRDLDTGTKNAIFLQVSDAGYDLETTYRLMLSMGLTKDEIEKFTGDLKKEEKSKNIINNPSISISNGIMG